ncbi:MAG: hypothetical protein HY075_01870, partial [Deltaproteobacteria bacterium]|nr:hypothetical protein [Deltaproteobacteria bacterium]
MARFHRRMSTISQLEAYNINGNIALRKEIGRKVGVDVALSSSFGGSEALSIDGMTRVERVKIAKSHPELFRLRSNGKFWMKRAYMHLNKWAEYTSHAWDLVQGERNSHLDSLLDPDLFTGRNEQTEKALANLKRLVPPLGSKEGMARIQGAITGEGAYVNVRDYFLNPPEDLKALMPTKFVAHQDIEALRAVYPSLRPSKKSTVTMKLDVGGSKRDVEWRNYLYGRAVGWDPV